MKDKEVINDILLTERFITIICNKNIQKCITDKVRDNLGSILDDENEMNLEILKEMQKRGWHNFNNATQNMISNLYSKYKVD